MRCTSPPTFPFLEEGVGSTTISAPFGSVASCLMYADVQFHILMTHNTAAVCVAGILGAIKLKNPNEKDLIGTAQSHRHFSELGEGRGGW